MKSLLISAIASAFVAGLVAFFRHHARKPLPITGSRNNPLAHGVRISLTDQELLDEAPLHRVDFGNPV